MSAEIDIDVAKGTAQPKGSKLKLIIILVVGMLVAAGGTVGALFALGLLPGAGAPAEGQTVEADTAPKRAIYVDFDHEFTVNFTEPAGARFLQVSLEAMTRDPEVERMLVQHMPVLRSEVMLILGAADSTTLEAREGKEALQTQLRDAMRSVLDREQSGAGAKLEAIYFTAFVMQ